MECEMLISDWSSDVGSSDLLGPVAVLVGVIVLNFDPPPGRFLHLVHKAVDVFEMVGTRFGHRGQAQDRLRGGGGAKSERQHARKSKNSGDGGGMFGQGQQGFLLLWITYPRRNCSKRYD